MRLSIIIPVFNEASSIKEILARVGRLKIEGVEKEIIVVDDCSTDGSREILQSSPQFYDQVVFRDRNGGKGAAVRDGLYRSTGDLVVFQDADLEYNPHEIERLVSAMNEGIDGVLGQRQFPTRDLHFFGNLLLTSWFNLLYGTKLSDVYTCYLLIRREFVDPDRLMTRGFEQQAEILSRGIRRGARLVNVPISYQPRSRHDGKKIRPWHFFPTVLTMVQIRFTHASEA